MEPDFVISLGTDKPTPNKPAEAPRGLWKNVALSQLCRLFWEKMRDEKVRQAFYGHPRYYRLNVEFDGEEPKLDDTSSISVMKTRTQGDSSLSGIPDNIARCVIASLLYFELDAVPFQVDGRNLGSGRILCSIRRHDPAFLELFKHLSSISAQLYINQRHAAVIDDLMCFDSDGSFRKCIDLNTEDSFIISLK
jgi:hypothetical protein